jgi:hypothetical protein
MLASPFRSISSNGSTQRLPLSSLFHHPNCSRKALVKMNSPSPLDSQTMPPQCVDEEKQNGNQDNTKHSVYKGLGWLDRLLVLWILLAIIIGILLGNFVDSVGPALQKGKFVNVSAPTGMYRCRSLLRPLTSYSCRTTRHDVPNSLQSEIRNAPSRLS